jgi:MarR family transcriptional regulator for hemolysin
MRNNFDRVLAEKNITRSQWGLIAVVARRPGATQRTVAEVLEMSEASAGRLIDRLCADGLLERRERDDDRRARAVYITPAAEPLLAQASEIGRELSLTIFRGLEHDDLETLAHLLAKVYDNVARTAPWRSP